MIAPMPKVSSRGPSTPEENVTQLSSTKTVARLFINDKVNCSMPEDDSPTTIQRVLAAYDIGAKLRQLRMRKKIALSDLGKHTGLSASMISQLENGKLIPTLPTLARIAMVFDVGLEYFFGNQKRRGTFSIVRKQERMRFPDRSGAVHPDYIFECLAFSVQDKALQAYWAEFPRKPAEEVNEHYHDGAEFVHVLEGSLTLRYANEDHIMKPGDSVYFDATEPHSYRGSSKASARAIVITTPARI